MASFCVFGDSIAKGVIYDAVKQKYILAKECCANVFERATGFVVKNYSRFGSTIYKVKELLQKHTGELAGYRNVILEFGGNDCDFHWDEISKDPDGTHFPNVAPQAFETEYGALIDDIRADGGKPVLLTIPPLHAPRFVSWISQGLDKEAIVRWLGDDEYYTYRWQERYNLAICHLAIEKEVPLIDIRQTFLEKIHYEDYLCADGMHPNAAGHQLIGNALCERWEQVSA